MARPSAKRPKTPKRLKGKIRRQEGDGDLPRKLLAVTAEILREQGLHRCMARLMLAWSAVHGFATLYLEKGFRPFYANNPKPPVAADAKRMLELLTGAFVRESRR